MNRLVLIIPLLAVLACGEDEPTGRVTLSWTGSDTGRLEAPATARWCPADTALEIVGIVADSGAGVAIFPPDTITPGVYPVGVPGESVARPRAGVALRRFGENLILGLYSLSGTVTVDTGSPLHGSLVATLKDVNTGSQLNVTGNFSGLVVESGEATCRNDGTATAADTGLF
jgi:hypothetical protein